MRLRALKPFDSGILGWKFRGDEFEAPPVIGRQLVNNGVAESIDGNEPLHKMVHSGRPLYDLGNVEIPRILAEETAPQEAPEEEPPAAEQPARPRSTNVRRRR